MTTKWQCHLVMDYLVEKGLGSTLFNEHITKRSWLSSGWQGYFGIGVGFPAFGRKPHPLIINDILSSWRKSGPERPLSGNNKLFNRL